MTEQPARTSPQDALFELVELAKEQLHRLELLQRGIQETLWEYKVVPIDAEAQQGFFSQKLPSSKYQQEADNANEWLKVALSTVYALLNEQIRSYVDDGWEIVDVSWHAIPRSDFQRPVLPAFGIEQFTALGMASAHGTLTIRRRKQDTLGEK